MNESDSMRGLFFIIKGKYMKNLEPSFLNEVTGDMSYIGGFNPCDDTTETWYRCVDRITFHCISCGSDLEKVVSSITRAIVKHKGSAKRYFKHVSDTTSEDYYETHYLGRTPLSDEQRSKKAEGRCPRVSPATKCMEKAIYEEWGDYYEEEIAEAEDRGYDLLKENTLVNRSRKLFKRTSVVTLPETPKTPEKVVPVKKKTPDTRRKPIIPARKKLTISRQ